MGYALVSAPRMWPHSAEGSKLKFDTMKVDRQVHPAPSSYQTGNWSFSHLTFRHNIHVPNTCSKEAEVHAGMHDLAFWSFGHETAVKQRSYDANLPTE